MNLENTFLPGILNIFKIKKITMIYPLTLHKIKFASNELP